MIDPEFWSDEKIGELSQTGRLLFIGMWNFANDVGIIKLRPEFLRSSIFPYDDLTFDDLQSDLDEIIKNGLLLPYTISGQKYGIILNFLKHQTINKPTPSKLPTPSIQNRDYQNLIFIRDNWTCHLCGKNLEGNYTDRDGKENMPSIDHLIPISKGGGDLPNNLATACLSCKKSRGNKPLPVDYVSPTGELLSQVKIREEKLSKEKLSELETTFEQFWTIYPRKEKKKVAKQTWFKICPDNETVAKILSSIGMCKETPQWKDQNGRFVPHPSTFLNQERWKDETPQTTNSPKTIDLSGKN